VWRFCGHLQNPFNLSVNFNLNKTRQNNMTRGLRNNNSLNIPRPNRYRNFERLEKTARLIAAMTCVENGIRWEQVDWDAIWQGYDLAYPGRRTKEPEQSPSEVEDVSVWDEYWDWSGLA
jgi:hypothetical protein